MIKAIILDHLWHHLKSKSRMLSSTKRAANKFAGRGAHESQSGFWSLAGYLLDAVPVVTAVNVPV